jgi:hypothetical protein
MFVVFVHGPAASGKHTIGSRLAAMTGLPLFHNHLTVDLAKSLFEFGSAPFAELRAAIWRASFGAAARAGRSFIFTFHPEASVDPALIGELARGVASAGGRVHFVELLCSGSAVRARLPSESRTKFGKLVDPALYDTLERDGAFRFPPLPEPLLRLDTERLSADESASRIAEALRVVEEEVAR